MISTVFLGVIAICVVLIIIKGVRDELRNEFKETSFLTPPSSYQKDTRTKIQKIEEMEGEYMTESKKIRNMPPPTIRTSGYHKELLQDTKHKQADMLIPQNLSEEDKDILKQFYNL